MEAKHPEMTLLAPQPDPDRPHKDGNEDDPDEAPETPLDEPPPDPVKDPPPDDTPKAPYVVGRDR